MTTFLLNETTSLDAGALTSTLTLAEQGRIDRVVITHPHFDHVATLPFFFENAFGRRKPIEIVAPPTVISPLRRHLFNGALWPDFSKLPSRRKATVKFHPIAPGSVYRTRELSFQPIPVHHIVPTYGYLVRGATASILFSGDTGPTQRLWRAADSAADLRAIFLEVSFSDTQWKIAAASRHLTPRQIPEELAKTRQTVPVFLYHMKPPSLAAIRSEIRKLKMPRLHFLRQGETLEF
ncbi:MAG: MBL fold metallo-hydrolase [Thermoanaerobaculia bacterium]